MVASCWLSSCCKSTSQNPGTPERSVYLSRVVQCVMESQEHCEHSMSVYGLEFVGVRRVVSTSIICIMRHSALLLDDWCMLLMECSRTFATCGILIFCMIPAV